MGPKVKKGPLDYPFLTLHIKPAKMVSVSAKTVVVCHFRPFGAKTAPVILCQNSPLGGKNSPGKLFWLVWSQNSPSFIMSN